MSYASSSFAFSLPSNGLKSTVRPSLTANTESSTRYLLLLSNICVTRGECVSEPIWDFGVNPYIGWMGSVPQD